MTNTDLIAAAQHDQTTGAVTYWQLSGTVTLAALADAWGAEGLPEQLLPMPVSPAVALQRACKAQQSATCLVRKHPQGGWALVQEERKDGTLAYNVGARFWIDRATNELQAAPAAEGGVVSPDLVAKVGAEYRDALAALASEDVSVWLVRLAQVAIKAVLLRETGGVYFVPRPQIERFHAIKRALARSTAHTVYEIPAVNSAEVVQAVYAGLAKEVADAIAGYKGDLAEEAIRGSTLAARHATCRELIGKVLAFEQLLGKPMGDAVAELGAIQQALRAAGEAKATRFELCEIDTPLTDDEIAAIDAEAKRRIAAHAAAQARLAAGTPRPAPQPVVEEQPANRFANLEVG